jgi:hypothetical protein
MVTCGMRERARQAGGAGLTIQWECAEPRAGNHRAKPPQLAGLWFAPTASSSWLKYLPGCQSQNCHTDDASGAQPQLSRPPTAPITPHQGKAAAEALQPVSGGEVAEPWI